MGELHGADSQPRESCREETATRIDGVTREPKWRWLRHNSAGRASRETRRSEEEESVSELEDGDDQGRAGPRPAFLPALPAAPLATGRQAQPNGRCAGSTQASEHGISRRTVGAPAPSQGGLTTEGQVRDLAAE